MVPKLLGVTTVAGVSLLVGLPAQPVRGVDAGDQRRGPLDQSGRAPGDPSTDFDVEALFTALDEQRRSRGLTWRAAAEEINAPFHEAPGALGINASTLTGMRTKSAVEADGVLQVLIWLDRTPESFVPNRSDTDGSPLPRVGPKRILRWDPAAIHAALEARRAERGLTWREVAIEIGLSPGRLTGLAKAQRVGFPQVMRIVWWLGRPAASFTRASVS